MVANLLLAIGSAWIAVVLRPGTAVHRSVAGGFVLLALRQSYCVASRWREPSVRHDTGSEEAKP